MSDIGVVDDMALASRLLDPFLHSRRVGQFLNVESEPDLVELYKEGMSDEQAFGLKMHAEKIRIDQPEFWTRKGLQQWNKNSGSGLWCDGSAGLAFACLTQQPEFRSSLTILEQGDAKRSGHWWIVANLGVSEPTYGGKFGDDSFTIDVWGALASSATGTIRTTCVERPACAFYSCGSLPGANKLKVHLTVHPPYERTDFIFGSEKTKKKKCFITTAVCSFRGQPDDCYELRALRDFRDGYLRLRSSGAADVEEYYRVAERIVDWIDASPSREAIYEEILETIIHPAIQAIENDDPDTAYGLYRERVVDLKDRFGIE